jgi:hypothetical protein
MYLAVAAFSGTHLVLCHLLFFVARSWRTRAFAGGV